MPKQKQEDPIDKAADLTAEFIANIWETGISATEVIGFIEVAKLNFFTKINNHLEEKHHE